MPVDRELITRVLKQKYEEATKESEWYEKYSQHFDSNKYQRANGVANAILEISQSLGILILDEKSKILK